MSVDYWKCDLRARRFIDSAAVVAAAAVAAAAIPTATLPPPLPSTPAREALPAAPCPCTHRLNRAGGRCRRGDGGGGRRSRTDGRAHAGGWQHRCGGRRARRRHGGRARALASLSRRRCRLCQPCRRRLIRPGPRCCRHLRRRRRGLHRSTGTPPALSPRAAFPLHRDPPVADVPAAGARGCHARNTTRRLVETRRGAPPWRVRPPVPSPPPPPLLPLMVQPPTPTPTPTALAGGAPGRHSVEGVPHADRRHAFDTLPVVGTVGAPAAVSAGAHPPPATASLHVVSLACKHRQRRVGAGGRRHRASGGRVGARRRAGFPKGRQLVPGAGGFATDGDKKAPLLRAVVDHWLAVAATPPPPCDGAWVCPPCPGLSPAPLHSSTGAFSSTAPSVVAADSVAPVTMAARCTPSLPPLLPPPLLQPQPPPR